MKTRNGPHRSLYGDHLTKMTFETRKKYEEYKKTTKEDLFESDISPTYKFLSDTFYGEPDYPVNVGLFDIEAEVDLSLGLGYPTPENAYGKINSISLYDRAKNEYHMIVLPESGRTILDLRDTEIKVVTHTCVSEHQLLDTFKWVIDDIDVLSGWNSSGYDIPYIIARAKGIYGQKGALSLLCRGGFKAQERATVDKFGNPFTKYTLVGRVHLDYMDLFKKFTFGERTSFSLGNICEEELGEKKLEYPGDLGDLYRNDPQKFYAYSLHDARLLKKLDDKFKMINLARTMARQATVKFGDVLGSIKYLEHVVMNHCHFVRENKLIMPNRADNEKKKYKGAYVVQTKPGIYGWACTVDIGSLYPSCIRAVNISPETHILQLEGRMDDFLKVVERTDDILAVTIVASGETEEIAADELSEVIRENGYTISANGSIFDSEKGVLPEVVEVWIEGRKEAKKKLKVAKDVGNAQAVEYYDLIQMSLKLCANSLYGAIGNSSCRFHSIDLAQSITLTGQIIEGFQCWKADQLVEELSHGA